MVEVIKRADGKRVQNLSYILGIDNGKMEEIISYSQLMDHLEAANEDSEINDDLYKFRALIHHQGPLKATDLNWKGCKYNVIVNLETGEKTYEPLSVLAAHDPVTCTNEDNEISGDLYKFRAFISHQGPLKPTDPNWKGCKYNVLVDWETGRRPMNLSQF